MTTATARSEYLGALLEDDSKLVLVPIDEKDPWTAFKTMRRTMRKNAKASEARMSLYESTTPVEHQAEVISLESRRRAG